VTHYDIALIGSGSGNSFPGPEFAGKSICYIEKGIGPDAVFGGTCLNLGCIPTKMFVHTADLAAAPADAARFGVRASLEDVDWLAIRDRIFDRIDPISAGGEEYRRSHPDNANLTLLRGTARFTGPKVLSVDLNDGGTEEVTADTVVLGAGSRPVLPPIPGLADAHPLTSETIMRVDALPRSLAILGSGIVAVEMAHIFSSLGVEVTVIARSGTLLRHVEADVSRRFTTLARRKWRVITDFTTHEVSRDQRGVRLRGEVSGPGEISRTPETIEAEELLVAVGRRANADLLQVAEAGIGTTADGRVRVDPFQRVLDPHGAVLAGVWAFGDLSSPHQLKHVANHELRVVRQNVERSLSGDATGTPAELLRSDTMPIPAGVFSSPQVAYVGLTEQEARSQGIDVQVAVQDYAGIAFGWALEDTTSFAKVVAERGSGRLLGAQIIGPGATVLVQLLVQAMSTGQTAADVARTQYWIHPALTELIENALLQLVD
jgi:mycothione reductase